MGTTEEIRARAHAIALAGGLNQALDSSRLGTRVTVSVAEGIILGLLRQGVRKFLGIFGHGNTAVGEIMRIYSEEGAIKVFHCRNEIAMAHAATALRWQYNEPAAILTSIGPGALQALAGSLAAASNGVGVYHIYGDETTHGEGYNMQQIPSPGQQQFGRLAEAMGALNAFTLHTPQALRDAMRRGAERVFHPYYAGPFYLLLPINVQPALIDDLNLAALPVAPRIAPTAPSGTEPYEEAAELIRRHRRIVIKAGGGSRLFGKEIQGLAEQTDAVVTLSPGALGILPDGHPRNMHVGGSKGSLSGNYAMENADLVIMVGSRAVCQADCSGTAYRSAQAVININGELTDLMHYNRTVALRGDIGAVVDRLREHLASGPPAAPATDWLADCGAKKQEWSRLKKERCAPTPIMDEAWGRPLLTQPAAIEIVAKFAKSVGAVKYFDAGDVQANGFQIVEDDDAGDTFTETGASYMGFAASAVLSAAIADNPRYPVAFSGDGSFLMSPQVLVDAAVHKARGMIVIFDNRRMAAISSLQMDQYGNDFATSDALSIDFVRLATSVEGVQAYFASFDEEGLRSALQSAYKHPGLSIVHVPVYWGDKHGGMGVYGRWNVGPWCEAVQHMYHGQAL